MKIVDLTIDDVEKYRGNIAVLLKQSFEVSFPRKTFEIKSFYERIDSLERYLKEEKAYIYGCLIEGNLVGFIWFFIKNISNESTIHINHFVIDKNYRRSGVGTALWNIVEEFATEKRINDIELLVTNSNEGAVNFYLNKNFEIERLVMKKRL